VWTGHAKAHLCVATSEIEKAEIDATRIASKGQAGIPRQTVCHANMNAPEMMTDSEEEEQLLSWVRLARAADGRQSLTLAGVPRQIATTLPDVLASWTTTRAATEERRLLLSLRAVRNLCVGHPEAQDQVDQAGLVAALAHVCDSFLDCRDSSQRGLVLEAALQTLGNACVQHVKNQEATWCGLRARVSVSALTLATPPGLRSTPGYSSEWRH
jgi:hypothetical protein